MTARQMLSVILVPVVLGIMASGLSACGTEDVNAASAPSDEEIQELQGQIRELQKQLDTLGNTQGAQSQQRLMQQNWQSMLEYMQGMQAMPWMMHGREMGPGMMGRGMMGWRHHGDWMMGCPMVGGPEGGWQLPPEMDAEQYRSQMLDNMQQMHDQMANIWSTPDPAERRRLMQEHWQGMYRNMQTMLGMGWMWGGGPGGQALAPLPAPDSQGAKLVHRYCTQCHAEPSPKLHTASEWEAVTSRMEMNMQNFRRGNWRGVEIPSSAEMKSILEYMQKFAR
ncbi:MAG: hypothetical protein JSU95_02945 [Betaproteobacteria bacterium]|nr:MAG: hypothetical protein JSU95_02945 [Betaproteobacteria bacterium]